MANKNEINLSLGIDVSQLEKRVDQARTILSDLTSIKNTRSSLPFTIFTSPRGIPGAVNGETQIWGKRLEEEISKTLSGEYSKGTLARRIKALGIGMTPTQMEKLGKETDVKLNQGYGELLEARRALKEAEGELPEEEYDALNKKIEVSIAETRQLIAENNKFIKLVKTIRDITSKSSKSSRQKTESKKKRQAISDWKETEAAIKSSANLYRLNASYTVLSNTLSIVTRGVKSLTQAYAEHNQAMIRFNLNFSDASDSAAYFNSQLRTTIEYLSKIEGYSGSSLRAIASDFYEMVRSFGASQELASAFSSNFVEDVAKVSRATGQTLEQTASAIQRVIATGESESVLNSLNLDLRKNSVKQWLVEKGIISSVNETLDEGTRALATQLYLHDQIQTNQNLSKNNGETYLETVRQINEGLEKSKQNVGSILYAAGTPLLKNIVLPIVKGVQEITSGLEKTSKTTRTILGYSVGIPLVLLSGAAATASIWVLTKKIKSLLIENIGYQNTYNALLSKASITTQAVAGGLLSIGIAIASVIGYAKLSSKSQDKVNESMENTSNITDEISSGLKEMQKNSEKAKGSLMGFDKLNILSMGTSSAQNDMLASLYSIQNNADSFSEMTEEIDKYNKKMKTAVVLSGLLTSAISVATTVGRLYNQILARKNAEQSVGNLLEKWKIAQKAEGITLTEAEIAQKRRELLAQEALNGSYKRGAMFKAALIGGVAALAITGAALGITAIANKSANGNFFPRASTTVIGEKYPEVAIPLGQSPQYAEMKQSIAKSVVEMLGGQAGEIKIVNQTVLDGRVIDERIRKVSRQDYKNQTGSNYKNVAMRK